MSRFDYLLPERFPDVPGPATEYPALLDRALREWYRIFRRAVRELDSPPLLVANVVPQSLPIGVSTQIDFAPTIDTQRWWFNGAYRPSEPGFYRCNWSVNFHDVDVIAPNTAASAAVRSYEPTVYGDGSRPDITVTGSGIVECSGSGSVDDAISVYARITAGDAPSVSSGYLTIEYIGRRFVAS